jgi:glycosyltransferase involved in cell wall biosynthesis
LKSLSVVMPAYNEEQNVEPMIGNVIKTFNPLVQELEVIIVNDGSRDRTGEKIQALAARDPRVRMVQHEKNRGYGAALYDGFIAAKKDWVFMTDSDRQFKLGEFQKLSPHANEADLIIGYRYPRSDPFHRRLYGWGWNSLVNLLFGYTARDVDCAFKLFKREIMDHINIASRGATFSAEFLARARRKGYKVVEVPVSHLPRLAGKPTGARVDVITRAFRELVRVRMALWREQ